MKKKSGEHNTTNFTSTLHALNIETADSSEPRNQNYPKTKVGDDEDTASLDTMLVCKLDIRFLPIIVFLYVLSKWWEYEKTAIAHFIDL